MSDKQPEAPRLLPVEPVAKHPLQGGMSNAELTDAWLGKLPGVIPSERELTAFAIGIEVGFKRAQELERQDWIRVHHALAKHGKHPGRTDEHVADVIDRALSAAPQPPAAQHAELIAKDAAIAELVSALRGLDDAYCRAAIPLTRDERSEDRRRLAAARAAIAKHGATS